MPRPLGSGNKNKPMEGWKKCSYLAHPETKEVLRHLAAAKDTDPSLLIETALRSYYAATYRNLPTLRALLAEADAPIPDGDIQESPLPQPPQSNLIQESINPDTHKPDDPTIAGGKPNPKTKKISERRAQITESQKQEPSSMKALRTTLESCHLHTIATELGRLRPRPKGSKDDRAPTRAAKTDLQSWLRAGEIPLDQEPLLAQAIKAAARDLLNP